MCIRDRVSTQSTWGFKTIPNLRKAILFARMEPTSRLTDLLKLVPQVDLDSEGVFKYILIQASFSRSFDPSAEVLTFVRGYKSCAYHPDILEAFRSDLRKHKINTCFLQFDAPLEEGSGRIFFRSPGGGRIQHSASAKKLSIYGYSQSFGQANHDLTLELAKKAYPDYPESSFTVSYEGY
eukprot:TRINITY_DN4564_c0_g1_i3.p1 TRINITY_DN4564_c0_g1~~TRINITY_DN4564_c0_g1_i3.p1  ORF type:complete len:180 (-),score=23.23 TRINITY_DN4564_c0_g1_i3:29-568(-)